jgi:hypothetical protein
MSSFVIKYLKLGEKVLLCLPFPVVLIWWVILGGFLGSLVLGPTYEASLGVIPVVVLGMWRVLIRYIRARR